jgi:uncharacterized protein YyaL (SSP411 family)
VKAARAAALALLAGCATHAPAPSAAIAWQPWSAETFARAKAENRLLLVDVVAEWCHWCHVMEKTTYADADVAAAIAADYVAVRVDHDARPDVAARYREWGWPATAILTPDARPVLERAGYQEPDEFERLLRSTAADFRAGRPIARETPARRAPPESDLTRIRDLVAAQLDSYYDAKQHGWGARQKYPLAAPVESEFLVSWLTGDAARLGRALATLRQETRLVDPVWGGMYQYSTRGDWEHPHFEKIVPVQAGAIANFAQAYAATGDASWLGWARRVRGYVSSFLTGEDGAFFTSQDADAGAHGDGAAWIHGPEYFALDDAARRAKGVPRVDTNVYADRNGLLIEALCRMYDSTGDEDALAMARSAAQRIVRTHAAPGGGFTHGDAAAAGAPRILFLADQAAMGRALLALGEATGDRAWTYVAEELARTMRDRLEDRDGGGFRSHTDEGVAEGVLAEPLKPFQENALAARFLVRLFHTTAGDEWRAAAERTLRALADPALIADQGRMVGDYLLALDELAHAPLHFDVVGKTGAADTSALLDAARGVYAPGRIVAVSAPGDTHPDIGRAAVYVCSDRVCSSPVTDPSRLADEVTSVLAAGR